MFQVCLCQVCLAAFLVAAAMFIRHLLEKMLNVLKRNNKQDEKRRSPRMCLKTDNTHSRLQVLRRPHVERPFYLPSDQVLHELNNNMTSFGDVIQVPPQLFEEMVSRLSPYLQRKVAYFPVALQVVVTLRYMATGCPLNELQKRF